MQQQPSPNLKSVASHIGLRGRGRRWGPCPACGAERTRHDPRPPLLLDKRWKCLGCNEGGDAISLVGFHLGLGGAPMGGNFALAMAVLETVDGSGRDEIDPEPVRVQHDVKWLLSTAKPVSEYRANVDLNAYLKAKGLTHEIPAGFLTKFPDWFRKGHPLVVPLFNGKGELVSMQGRSITGPRSLTNPTGMDGRGRLMLDPKWCRPWARGLGPVPDRVYIMEGMTDYLAGSLDGPTIGIVEGSADALRLLPWKEHQRVYVGTHPDMAGDKYAKNIIATLWPRDVKRLPLDRVPG